MAIAVAIGFGLFVAVLAFGVSIARFGNLPSGPSPPTSEQVENIVNDIVNVSARTYEYRQFTVPVDATNAIVRGNFFVNSTDGDTIQVMILNLNSFSQWQIDPIVAENYYSSTQVTTADLEADVPSGQTLYLVFDNTRSTVTKIVDADIELAYLR
jgi:hypothetical protein